MIGWKLLTHDGTSLREEGRHVYRLPVDGEPGPWDTVPGNGAYVAVTGGLLAGGIGALLARLESPDDEPDVCDSGVRGVRCRRTVRVLAAWPLAAVPPDVAANLPGVLLVPPDGNVIVEPGRTALVLRGAPTVHVARGAECATYGHSAPTVRVGRGGRCDTWDDSAPTVRVGRGGWCATYGHSAPTVRVGRGAECATYDQSTPTVHVARGGRCDTWDDSAPTVHVGRGGWCATYDHSAPTVHVDRGAECIPRRDSRPKIIEYGETRRGNKESP